ncbi:MULTISPECIES: hypothetical protein [Bacillus]|uniref:Uncharacterized protein n=1 Tax=Bacillus vallismortis TaxID=72361 RepID=A0ABY4Y3R5_BACVA|nr:MULTISPECIES: hypothetical protein [Bacillus]MBL3647054.1 hypothetical protein [Bacillus sp. RHFS10]USP97246.1 hypothetical protein MKF32_09410 [Bacillus vallismortis]
MSLNSFLIHFQLQMFFFFQYKNTPLDNQSKGVKRYNFIFYEIWQGTKDSWLQEELPNPYRKKYEEVVGDLLEDRIISWLTPNGEWGSNLTNVSR